MAERREVGAGEEGFLVGESEAACYYSRTLVLSSFYGLTGRWLGMVHPDCRRVVRDRAGGGDIGCSEVVLGGPDRPSSYGGKAVASLCHPFLDIFSVCGKCQLAVQFQHQECRSFLELHWVIGEGERELGLIGSSVNTV